MPSEPAAARGRRLEPPRLAAATVVGSPPGADEDPGRPFSGRAWLPGEAGPEARRRPPPPRRSSGALPRSWSSARFGSSSRRPSSWALRRRAVAVGPPPDRDGVGRGERIHLYHRRRSIHVSPASETRTSKRLMPGGQARAVIAERVWRGLARPPERLGGRSARRDAGRGRSRGGAGVGAVGRVPGCGSLVVLVTLAQYVGIVEALADEADREDGDDGETMH